MQHLSNICLGFKTTRQAGSGCNCNLLKPQLYCICIAHNMEEGTPAAYSFFFVIHKIAHGLILKKTVTLKTHEGICTVLNYEKILKFTFMSCWLLCEPSKYWQSLADVSHTSLLYTKPRLFKRQCQSIRQPLPRTLMMNVLKSPATYHISNDEIHLANSCCYDKQASHKPYTSSDVTYCKFD